MQGTKIIFYIILYPQSVIEKLPLQKLCVKNERTLYKSRYTFLFKP